MYSFYDLQDKVRRYFRFNNDEIKGLLITTLILAICLSFRQWGYGETVDVYYGLKNLLNTFVIVFLAILVHVSAQKVYALHIGYKAEYEMWLSGLIISLFLTVLTNGYLYFLAIGSFVLHFLHGHRLGYFRFGLNYFAMAIVALMGPLANLILALIFKYAMLFSSSPLLPRAMSINLLIAIFSMIPIPPFDGSKVFYASRYLYAFSVGAVIGAVVFMFFSGAIGTILGSLFVGLLVLLIPLWLDYGR